MWFNILKRMSRASAQKYIDDLTKEILDELKRIYGKDSKVFFDSSGYITYMSKEYSLHIAKDMALRDLVDGDFGGEDFGGEPVDINIDAITYYGIDEQDKERLGEDYLFNIPTNVIYGYTLGQYGDPPHFEIKTFEENPQVKQFVNKKQKEIIERFGMMGANIHPAMYLTPEQVEEVRESQNWRKELEE
tara:strand:+ start:50 stop:616 length:567 start_codon:yes stop_codon:yes gene_type:complete